MRLCKYNTAPSAQVHASPSGGALGCRWGHKPGFLAQSLISAGLPAQHKFYPNKPMRPCPHAASEFRHCALSLATEAAVPPKFSPLRLDRAIERTAGRGGGELEAQGAEEDESISGFIGFLSLVLTCGRCLSGFRSRSAHPSLPGTKISIQFAPLIRLVRLISLKVWVREPDFQYAGMLRNGLLPVHRWSNYTDLVTWVVVGIENQIVYRLESLEILGHEVLSRAWGFDACVVLRSSEMWYWRNSLRVTFRFPSQSNYVQRNRCGFTVS
jgi:hypothetical protein